MKNSRISSICSFDSGYPTDSIDELAKELKKQLLKHKLDSSDTDDSGKGVSVDFPPPPASLLKESPTKPPMPPPKPVQKNSLRKPPPIPPGKRSSLSVNQIYSSLPADNLPVFPSPTASRVGFQGPDISSTPGRIRNIRSMSTSTPLENGTATIFGSKKLYQLVFSKKIIF